MAISTTGAPSGNARTDAAIPVPTRSCPATRSTGRRAGAATSATAASSVPAATVAVAVSKPGAGGAAVTV